MAKITFQYGSPYKNGNSRLKLLIYLDGKLHASPYSFDGRYHLTGGKPRLTDDEKHFSEENARRHLQKMFADNYQHLPRLTYAAIVDSRYPSPNVKFRVWSIAAQQWQTLEAANAQAHQAYTAAKTAKMPELYTLRLSVPMLKSSPNETVKWKNFFTAKPDAGNALMHLIAQYTDWRKVNPTAKPQRIGQFFGKPFSRFSTDEADVPRFAWFDTDTTTPKYHGTHRTVTAFAQLQAQEGAWEEFISNC